MYSKMATIISSSFFGAGLWRKQLRLPKTLQCMKETLIPLFSCPRLKPSGVCFHSHLNLEMDFVNQLLDLWEPCSRSHPYLSSGCVHGWMMPFMSRYRLSNSTSLGLGRVVSTGIRTPLHSRPCGNKPGWGTRHHFWVIFAEITSLWTKQTQTFVFRSRFRFKRFGAKRCERHSSRQKASRR